MSRELATVFAQFIPANAWFDSEEFDYMIIDSVVYEQGVITGFENEDGLSLDSIGVSLIPVGMQSSEWGRDSSLLWLLYDEGAEQVYSDDDVVKLAGIARVLRENNNQFVSFMVALNCDVTPDSDTWICYEHGDAFSEITHFCDTRTFQWMSIDA